MKSNSFLLGSLVLILLCIFIPRTSFLKGFLNKNPFKIDNSLENSLLRIEVTKQVHNEFQPWNKRKSELEYGMGIVIENNKILTSAELVADHIFIEIKSTQNHRSFQAQIESIDYNRNLALLAPVKKEGLTWISENFTSLQIGNPVPKGSSLQIIQIEDSGAQILSNAVVQDYEVVPSLTTRPFLSYKIKSSLQRAPYSFTLPVLNNNKVAGLLDTYSHTDQNGSMIPTEVIKLFLKSVKEKNLSFKNPMLGVTTTATNDKNFREFLKLDLKEGGVYVSKVVPSSPADLAGIRKGDVITKIENNSIDSLGYYHSSFYDNLSWVNLITSSSRTDASLGITLHRRGKKISVPVQLKPFPKPKIAKMSFGVAPRFFIKGGLIFRNLTVNYLSAFGKNWKTRAPLNLLKHYNNPEKINPNLNSIVLISNLIPTPATLGYEDINNTIVHRVNGVEIVDLNSLEESFSKPLNKLHHIEISTPPYSLYLDAKLSARIDSTLLKRGIHSLKRL